MQRSGNFSKIAGDWWIAASVSFVIVFLAYINQIFLPSYNQDDISQIQPRAGDGSTFLAVGRWGYYVVFVKIFDQNPGGPFAFILGLVILVSAGAIGSSAFKINTLIGRILFITISSIAVYYGQVFSFDSTRIAYPVSTLLGSAGAVLLIKRRWLFGIAILALSPAFYTSGLLVALTILAAHFLIALSQHPLIDVIANSLKFGASVALALALYYVSFEISIYLTGTWRQLRGSAEAASDIARIFNLYYNFALPFRRGRYDPYYPALLQIFNTIGLIVLLGYLIRAALHQRYFYRIPPLIIAFLAMMAAPIAIGLFAAYFPMRAMFAFAILTAISVTVPLEKATGYARFGLIAVGFAIVGTSAVQMNKRAVDEHLASQSDFMLVNRIISRIEQLPGLPVRESTIPIVVETRGHGPRSGPRGSISSALWSPWSRENVFQFVDKRFEPVRGSARTPFVETTLGRVSWPAEESVYLQDGVVVVVLGE